MFRLLAYPLAVLGSLVMWFIHGMKKSISHEQQDEFLSRNILVGVAFSAVVAFCVHIVNNLHEEETRVEDQSLDSQRINYDVKLKEDGKYELKRKE